MDQKITFPFVFGDKVYYSLDEVPQDIKDLLNKKLENSTLTSNITTQRWEINGVVYNRFEDIPPEFQKFLEDKNNNGIPDFLEEKVKNTNVLPTFTKLKETPLDSNPNLHKDKYSGQKKNLKSSNSFLIIALLLIIIGLLGYIILKM